MTLGQRIQDLRRRQDLSQEGLGEKLGVSRQAVSRWEMDGAVPEVDKLVAMGKLFGVSVDELLHGEGAPEQAAPPGGVPPKKRGLLTPALCLAAFVLGMAACTVATGTQLGNLQDRLTRLEDQIQQIEARPAGLDPAAPLVADVNVSVSESIMKILFTAAQLPEELEVTVTAASTAGRGDPVQEKAKPLGGGLYSVSFWPGTLSAPISVTAVFSDGTAEYACGLVRIDSIGSNGWTGQYLWNISG